MKLFQSFRFKYFICLLAVSVIPVLVVSVFTAQSNRVFYNRQIEHASASEVRKITSRIDENYDGIQNLISSLLYSTYDGNSCMLNICAQEGEGKYISKRERLKNYRMFKYVCTTLLENARHAEGVYLICENGKVYSYLKSINYGIERQYAQDEWYQTLMQNEAQLEITDMVPLKGSNFRQGEQCLLSARKFQSFRGKEKAILAVVYGNGVFDEVAQEKNLPWGEVLVINSVGDVLYGNADSIGLTREELRTLSEKESGTIYTRDIQKAYIFGHLEMNDWIVVSSLSLESFRTFFVKNSRILYVILGIDILVIMIVLYFLDRTNVKPIVHLAKIMRSATGQNFEFHNEYENRKDEVGILYVGYEKLIRNINRLIEEGYENQIRILRSRLRNLTSQINAHFIFNTLENISSLAQIEGNREIGIMSKSLGDMLHYSMDIENDVVRLEDEIKQIRQYLNIQEVRFENPVNLQLDLAKDTQKRKVMKFMLQPIVENAIEHGFTEQDYAWNIGIRTEVRDGKILIHIKDNGVGMEPEALEKVRKKIYEKKGEEKGSYHIGLSNIHQRIQLLFSDKYGLTIESDVEQGTTVTIALPLM